MQNQLRDDKENLMVMESLHNNKNRKVEKSLVLLKNSKMPITDAIKKQIAQQRRLFFKICFKCGSKNPISNTRCRKCHGSQMRLKNRHLGAKK